MGDAGDGHGAIKKPVLVRMRRKSGHARQMEKQEKHYVDHDQGWDPFGDGNRQQSAMIRRKEDLDEQTRPAHRKTARLGGAL